MQNTLLSSVEIEPSHPATASIIWLHGLGANGHDFSPIVPSLAGPDSTWRFVFPHAPKRSVTINGGFVMPAWYDVTGLELSEKEDEVGIVASSEEIKLLIEQERSRGIPADKIVLAGFSQGGAIALHCGLSYSKKLAGILVLSSYLPLSKKFRSTVNVANQATSIFIAHGMQDTTVPMMFGQGAAQFLKKEGYLVDFKNYPMNHSVCEQEIQDIREWLGRVLK